MTDIAMRYFRCTHGPVFEACDAWTKKHDAATAEADAIALEIGGIPGRHMMWGTLLEGLYRLGEPPKGWRVAGKKFPGYIKPNKRCKEGEAFAKRMAAIKIPSGEDLAHALGFAPFFMASNGGHYCSSATCNLRGGVYYLEFPTAFGLQMQTKDGCVEIKEWEYLKALDGQ